VSSAGAGSWPRSCGFLDHQYAHRSGYAANCDRKNLAAAWKWGAKNLPGFPVQHNPFEAVERYPEEQCPLIPPLEDFMSVIDMATGQDRVMLLTFFHLGARRGEERGDLGQGGAAAQQDTKKSCGTSRRQRQSAISGPSATTSRNCGRRWRFSAAEARRRFCPSPKNVNPRSGNSRGSEYPAGVSTGGPNG
jgi:hypothetical protein